MENIYKVQCHGTILFLICPYIHTKDSNLPSCAENGGKLSYNVDLVAADALRLSVPSALLRQGMVPTSFELGLSTAESTLSEIT